MEYKYTYQDWLLGNMPSDDIVELCLGKFELSLEDYRRIIVKQNGAFQKRIIDYYELLKASFKDEYDVSLVKRDYLDFAIEQIEQELQYIKLEHYDVYKNTVMGFDGRWKLTASQVEKFNAFSYENLSELEYYDYKSEIENQHDLTPFIYILKSNYLTWLYWFKADQEQEKDEPKINLHLGNKAVYLQESILNKNRFSYKWLNEPNKELVELYKLLKDNTLIDADTTLDQLEAVFTQKPLDTIQAIKWHDDNASELLFFIRQLEQLNNIDHNGRTDYIKLRRCFVKPNGKSFDEAFKSLKTSILTNLSEAKQQVIRDIVSQF
jgi:hypothetical protein